MKRLFIPLLVTVTVLTTALMSCTPSAAPTPTTPTAPTPTTPTAPTTPEPTTPEPTTPTDMLYARDIPELKALIDEGSLDADLPMNPFGGSFGMKPDGSRYEIADVNLFVYCDWCYNQTELNSSLITRAGAKHNAYDANFDLAMQVSIIEDLIAFKGADAIIVSPVQEYQIVPAVEQAVDAGIPVFVQIQPVYSDKVTHFAGHDYGADYIPGYGTDTIGQWYVDYVEKTNEPIHVFEMWGSRSAESSVLRHQGFHKGLADHPMITVTESADSNYVTELMAEFVLDAMTAEPTINALFQQGGGTSGPIEALRSMGRLKEIGDPDHVIIATNECDNEIVEAMYEGYIDAFCTNSPLPQVNVSVCQIFNSVVLGQSVAKENWMPMVVITPENISTTQQFGAPAAWAKLPYGKWDLWPVLDVTELGVNIPTTEQRQELLGY